MYIINPAVGEEGTAAIVEKFKTLIEANGTLISMEELGKKKLAYLIEKFVRILLRDLVVYHRIINK